MFYVYYLVSKLDLTQHYTGYTENIQVRIEQHNSGLVLSTKPYRPWELVFYEAYKSKKDAKRRELYFKTTKSRKALKLMLKNSLNSTL
jgi:putative endonuclease